MQGSRTIHLCYVACRLRGVLQIFFAVVLLGLGAAPAAAQSTAEREATGKEQETAEVLFFQGKALLETGETETACNRLAASARLSEGVGVLLYLGQCWESAGRFVSARDAFLRAQRLAASRGDESRREIATIRATALDPRVPVLRLVAPGRRPPRFRVSVDGAPLALEALKKPLVFDAGELQVQARAPGYQPWTAQVTLRNDSKVVVLTIPELEVKSGAAARAGGGREPEASSAVSTWGWVLSGAAVVSLGASAFLSVSALDKNSNADCEQNLCSSPEAVRQVDDAQSQASLATIFGVGGLVLGATGLTLILAAPDASSEAPSAYFGVGGVF